MSEHVDTRQNPGNRPSINEGEPEPDMEENIVITDDSEKLLQLVNDKAALEKFQSQVESAGRDGLCPVANQALRIGLAHVTKDTSLVSNESYTDINISAEDIGEKLKAVGKRILEVIQVLIDKAKQYATKLMSGIDSVKSDAEELIKRATAKRTRSSNELHDDKTITIESPGILMTDGTFCLDDCKSETEVIKFFQTAWPTYATEQIKRARKMIGEYDVESGNSENFKANAEFLGNHSSLVNNITSMTLPGNKKIQFKYVALGPELVDDEDAKPAPDSYTLEVREASEIVRTLKTNIERMRQLSILFTAEGKVLDEMRQLSQGVSDLESRRGETIFKGARDDLSAITNMVMGLIDRLKPSYDPIARHLARVGSARNSVCRRELDARG